MSQPQKDQQPQERQAKTVAVERSRLYKDLVFCANTQNDVNTAMTGENWRDRASGKVDDGDKPVDYPMALLDEAAEFWASTIDFKWWAKTEFTLDRGNAIVELVDMLHFALSQDLIENTPEQVASAMDLAFVTLSEDLRQPVAESPILAVRRAMKQFMHGITASTPVVNWKAFWAMAIHLNVDPAILVYKYRAKALLNKFRTSNGAKAGSYKKKWLDGKEDNYYLMLHLDSILALGLDYPGDEALAEWLSKTYFQMTSIQAV